MLSATPVAAAHGGAYPPPPFAPPTPMVAAGAAAALPCSLEDPSRKVRKPYTITKSRESWSEVEHDKFLEALHLFDRDWKKIEAFVGSKTVIQIRSHAQKYFLKVQKNGTSEHVPPPRPKRKAAHPYPQKALKNAAIITQAVAPLPASSLVLEPCYTASSDSSTVVRNSTSNATMSSCVNGSVQPFSAAQMTKVPSEAIMANNCCSRTESPTEVWLASETTEKENQVPFLRVIMPDFSQVYSFLAGVFDPNTGGHLEKLKEMDPIDVETVLLLMRNLSANLTSPDFEAHRRLLSTYGSGTEEANSNSFSNLLQASRTPVTPFMVEVE
uniref:Uncharacterized protein n=1 Tax=Ananas comosus var. bracteatus TaxID=296719 RepID=A0A6V7NR18_ANACO|nr:unnamed protein product [Ananas comosus var. bracteatus]